jgi:hypothetical protein
MSVNMTGMACGQTLAGEPYEIPNGERTQVMPLHEMVPVKTGAATEATGMAKDTPRSVFSNPIMVRLRRIWMRAIRKRKRAPGFPIR